jgi:tetratricopeptide (TPR) repeat protein
MLAAMIQTTKFLGIALAGLFGLLGVLTDYRDKQGRVTSWGRIALFGTIISTGVALASQELDFLKSARDEHETSLKALEQAKANAAMLQQIGRAVDPLDSFIVDAWLRLALNDPELSSYRERATKLIQQALASAKPGSEKLDGNMVASITNSDKSIVQVSFGPDSPAFPDPKKEPIAYFALRYMEFALEFYEQVPDLTVAPSASLPAPDLEIMLNTADPPAQVDLTYDVATGNFGISAWGMQTDPKYWRNTRNVLAVSDLPGRHMIVAIRSVTTPSATDAGLNAKLLRIRSNLEFRSMLIKLPRGRNLWVHKWPLANHDDSGLPFFDLTFPSTNAQEFDVPGQKSTIGSQ